MATMKTEGGVTTIQIGHITARVAHEEGGWHAEYLDRGEVVEDSEKVGSPDMPTHKSARTEALRIAIHRAAELAAEDDDIIRELRREAAEAGDDAHVALCDSALNGDAAARRRNAEILADAAAQA